MVLTAPADILDRGDRGKAVQGLRVFRYARKSL